MKSVAESGERKPAPETLWLKTVTVCHLGAFRNLVLELGPGINLLTGMNGTGKTNFLKWVFSGLTAPPDGPLEPHFFRNLLPPAASPALLVFREGQIRSGSLSLESSDSLVRGFHVEKTGKGLKDVRIIREKPGILSEPFSGKVFYFPFDDSCPEIRKNPGYYRSLLLRRIEKSVPGRVVLRGGRWWLKNARGWAEWEQVTPATRQMAILSLILRKGMLKRGSLLLWDTPEGVFGPVLAGEFAGILAELARKGVQSLVATRDYVLQKEIDLHQDKEIPPVRFHGFFRDDRQDKISVESSDHLSGLVHNPALDTFRSLFDRDIERAITGKWSP